MALRAGREPGSAWRLRVISTREPKLHRTTPVRGAMAATIVLAALAATPALATAAAAPVTVSAQPITAPLQGKATTSVTLANTTKQKLTGLRVSVSVPKGISASGRGVPAIAPGKSASVKVTLTRKASGPTSGTAKIRVTRKGKVVAGGSLPFGTGTGTSQSAPSTTPPAPPANPNTLAGRYFWHSQYTINGIQQYPLFFANDTTVANDTDLFKDAWPTCAAGCANYTYNGASGQGTINGAPFSVTGHKLTFDGDSYDEVASPPAGTRWDTTITYSNSSGICPLMCNYYTENLTFLPDGTFARDSVASGTSPTFDYAAVPANRRGTYEITADHLLHLNYADGTVRVDTVAQWMNADGSLQAPGEGVLLDGDGYFDIRK
jgi:hypothetical protein